MAHSLLLKSWIAFFSLVGISFRAAGAFSLRPHGPHLPTRISHCHTSCTTGHTFQDFHPSFRVKPYIKCCFPFSNTCHPSALGVASSSSSSDDDNMSSSKNDDDDDLTSRKLTFRERWAKAFPKKETDEERLPLRQRLAKMGLACVLSYGFVSNLNAGITTSVAWFLFSKRVSRQLHCPYLLRSLLT